MVNRHNAENDIWRKCQKSVYSILAKKYFKKDDLVQNADFCFLAVNTLVLSLNLKQVT